MMTGNWSDSNAIGSGGCPYAARQAKDEALVQVVSSKLTPPGSNPSSRCRLTWLPSVPTKLFEH